LKGLVKVGRGVGLVELREVPTPTLAPGEVLIRVKAAGICGSDIHIFHDQFPYHPPVILGHEFAGEIAALGSQVQGWTKGDRVVAELHTRACGRCRYCRTGSQHLCPEKRAPGWGIDGAFAEYIVMPSQLLHVIPAGVSFPEAALAEPTAIAVQAVLGKGRVQPGDLVVVLGPGPIGLLCAQIARSCGGKVVITGTERDRDTRLAVAGQLGIDHVVDTSLADPLLLIQDLSGGAGADVVVETAGVAATINQAIQMVRPQGLILAVGIPEGEKIAVDWSRAVFKGADVRFCFSSTFPDWERSLAMLATGQIAVKPMINGLFNLEDWAQAFALITSGKGIKALLIPNP